MGTHPPTPGVTAAAPPPSPPPLSPSVPFPFAVTSNAAPFDFSSAARVPLVGGRYPGSLCCQQGGLPSSCVQPGRRAGASLGQGPRRAAQGRGGDSGRLAVPPSLLSFKKKLRQNDHVGKIGQLFSQCLVSDGQGRGEEQRTKDRGVPV